MNRLFNQRYLIRQNLLTLIGVCLCFYFSYHAVQGNRSALTLLSLNRSIATMSLDATSLRADRQHLEQKVRMLRPGSLSRDLLEERVRAVLGYKYADEVAVLSN